MYTMKEYIQAESPEQAAMLLRQNRRNAILGGNMWLRMSSRSIHTGIDLCGLGLDRIEKTDRGIRIGAMVTLAAFRDSAELAALTHGAARRCVSPIVGTQFQNMATIGGGFYSRFGFSDSNTLLLALDASGQFALSGTRGAEAFFARSTETPRDVLTHIELPDKWEKVAFTDFRNTSTDLPVLNCACAAGNGTYRIAVGARPARSALCPKAAEAWKNGEDPETVARIAAAELSFGSNGRGSAAYRKALCRQLVAQCIREAETC